MSEIVLQKREAILLGDLNARGAFFTDLAAVLGLIAVNKEKNICICESRK